MANLNARLILWMREKQTWRETNHPKCILDFSPMRGTYNFIQNLEILESWSIFINLMLKMKNIFELSDDIEINILFPQDHSTV